MPACAGALTAILSHVLVNSLRTVFSNSKHIPITTQRQPRNCKATYFPLLPPFEIATERGHQAVPPLKPPMSLQFNLLITSFTKATVFQCSIRQAFLGMHKIKVGFLCRLTFQGKKQCPVFCKAFDNKLSYFSNPVVTTELSVGFPPFSPFSWMMNAAPQVGIHGWLPKTERKYLFPFSACESERSI